MFPPTSVPPDLQAEAEAYQRCAVGLAEALTKLYVSQDHNRERGARLIKRMAEAGVHTIVVDGVVMQPHGDGQGFNRWPLDPHVPFTSIRPRRPSRRPPGGTP